MDHRKKYLFFDIDGTLTDKKSYGHIPEDTKKALQLAKQEGHFLALATGRSYLMAKPFADELKIDYLVCNGGNDIYIHQACLCHESLESSFCKEVLQECLDKNIPFCVNLDESVNRYAHNDAFYHAVPKDCYLGDMHIDEHMDPLQLDIIERIMIAIDQKEESSIDAFHHHYFPMRYNPYYCIIEPDHKGDGILKMLGYVHGSIEDAVVFGDSRNDLTMFQKIPCSIAMGNATKEIKQLASYITKSSNHGGIQHALQHFGWIK